MRISPIKLVVVIVLVCALILGVRFLTRDSGEPVINIQNTNTTVRHSIIGLSREKRAITSYVFGTQTTTSTNLIFVGGMHGGYEWNSTLLAYTAIDYFTNYPEAIPSDITITIIPVLNPDGLASVLGSSERFTLAEALTGTSTPLGIGRFNANDVDLNRNFDCKWQAKSSWRGNTVSAGDAPFSEPEAQILRDLILKNKPDGVIFWHSQANAVYASECEEGILPETRTLMNIYATSADYPAIDTFDAYSVTGDAEGWLASIHIPAITVELGTHETIEWGKNLAGIKALLKHYSNT